MVNTPLIENTVRARATMILLGVFALLSVGEMINNIRLWGLLSDFNPYSYSDSASVDAALEVLLTIAYATMALYFVVAIVWIMWIYRSYCNLRRLALSLKYTTGWAIASWLIPIMNLGRPYFIVTDTIRSNWRIIKVFNPDDSAHIPKEKPVTRLTGFWWGIWVFYRVGSTWLVMSMSSQNNTVSGLRIYIMLTIILGIIKIGADILAILVVARISKIEDETFRIWKSGAIDEYKERKEQGGDLKPDSSAPATWYKTPEENEAALEPDTTFVDQRSSKDTESGSGIDLE